MSEYRMPFGPSDPCNLDVEDRRERQEAAEQAQTGNTRPLAENAAQETHEQIERALGLLCNALIDCTKGETADWLLRAIRETKEALFAAARDLPKRH